MARIGETQLGRQQLLDLAGDGQLDVVSFAGAAAGFYERTQDDSWYSLIRASRPEAAPSSGEATRSARRPHPRIRIAVPA